MQSSLPAARTSKTMHVRPSEQEPHVVEKNNLRTLIPDFSVSLRHPDFLDLQIIGLVNTKPVFYAAPGNVFLTK